MVQWYLVFRWTCNRPDNTFENIPMGLREPYLLWQFWYVLWSTMDNSHAIFGLANSSYIGGSACASVGHVIYNWEEVQLLDNAFYIVFVNLAKIVRFIGYLFIYWGRINTWLKPFEKHNRVTQGPWLARDFLKKGIPRNYFRWLLRTYLGGLSRETLKRFT